MTRRNKYKIVDKKAIDINQSNLERGYEAIKPGRLRKTSRDARTSSAIAREANKPLLYQARFADENNDIARGILNVLVANIIGNGIEIEPQIRLKSGELSDQANKQILSLWDDWKAFPEVTGALHWAAVERMVCRTLFRDGEIFIKEVVGFNDTLDHGTTVPYSIELIESDYVPIGQGFPSQFAIDGIERNSWGRPIAYWVSKRNPTDTLPSVDYSRIDAGSIIHLKHADRVGQNRGISIFASVLTRLEDLKDYEESERIAAKIAASLSAYVKKGDSAMYERPSDTSERLLSMSPGMIFDNLVPGEEIGMIDSSRPNPNLEIYRNAQLKPIAASTYTGFSSISKNYDNSYAAQRQEMVEQSVLYKILRDYFIERFSRRVWKSFVSTAVASNKLNTRSLDVASLFNADFRGQGLPWLDIEAEVNAEIKAIQAGIKSKSQVQRERNINPATVFGQIVSERKAEKENDLILSSNFEYSMKSGTAQAISANQQSNQQGGK